MSIPNFNPMYSKKDTAVPLRHEDLTKKNISKYKFLVFNARDYRYIRKNFRDDMLGEGPPIPLGLIVDYGFHGNLYGASLFLNRFIPEGTFLGFKNHCPYIPYNVYTLIEKALAEQNMTLEDVYA